MTASQNLTAHLNGHRFSTVLADSPWRFSNRTGKVAPEHRRLSRYPTLSLQEIADLPVEQYLRPTTHWDKLQERLDRGVGRPVSLATYRHTCQSSGADLKRVSHGPWPQRQSLNLVHC